MPASWQSWRVYNDSFRINSTRVRRQWDRILVASCTSRHREGAIHTWWSRAWCGYGDAARLKTWPREIVPGNRHIYDCRQALVTGFTVVVSWRVDRSVIRILRPLKPSESRRRLSAEAAVKWRVAWRPDCNFEVVWCMTNDGERLCIHDEQNISICSRVKKRGSCVENRQIADCDVKVNIGNYVDSPRSNCQRTAHQCWAKKDYSVFHRFNGLTAVFNCLFMCARSLPARSVAFAAVEKCVSHALVR